MVKKKRFDVQKRTIFGGSKTELSLLHKNFFLKIFGHVIRPGCSDCCGLQLSGETEPMFVLGGLGFNGALCM